MPSRNNRICIIANGRIGFSIAKAVQRVKKMSKVIQPGYPRLESMASGQQSIAIGKCSYDEFSDCSHVWAARLGAEIIQAIDGPDTRLLIVQIEHCNFWISFDEFFHEICLEPQDLAGGKIIPSIYGVINGMNKITDSQ